MIHLLPTTLYRLLWQEVLISSEPLCVDHFNNLFGEQGVETSDIEIITNPEEGIGRSWDLIRSEPRSVDNGFYC